MTREEAIAHLRHTQDNLGEFLEYPSERTHPNDRARAQRDYDALRLVLALVDSTHAPRYTDRSTLKETLPMPTTMTITEALADIKTSSSRIDKKREAVLNHLYRDGQLRDPMDDGKGGNSTEFVKRERQGIGDLLDKIVRIRCAIQAKNLEISLTIEGETRSVAGWLNWRREISKREQELLQAMSSRIQQARQQATPKGYAMQSGQQPLPPGGLPQPILLINVDERALAAEIERLASILGQLDGKLSLLNATTTIDV